MHTITQAAKAVNLSNSRIYQLLEEEGIDHVKDGRRVFIPDTGIEQLKNWKELRIWMLT